MFDAIDLKMITTYNTANTSRYVYTQNDQVNRLIHLQSTLYINMTYNLPHRKITNGTTSMDNSNLNFVIPCEKH